jgi:hypothetical protein
MMFMPSEMPTPTFSAEVTPPVMPMCVESSIAETPTALALVTSAPGSMCAWVVLSTTATVMAPVRPKLLALPPA